MTMPQMSGDISSKSGSNMTTGDVSQYVGPKIQNFAAPGGNSTLLIIGIVLVAGYVYLKRSK